MSEGTERSLVREVLTGDNRQLRSLAAAGVLPLAQDELVELQVELTRGDDDEIAATARESLAQLDLRFLVPFLREEASPTVVEYFARYGQLVPVVEAAAQHRSLSAEALHAMAGDAAPEIQEIVLLRQDLIVERPEILDALEANPRISSYARRLIGEYRDHLLGGRLRAAREQAEQAALEQEQEATDEEVQRELARVAAEVAVEGEVDDQTGLSEGQIRALTAAVKARLARGATRSLRAILVRDPAPHVALTVLSSSPVTEGEIEQIAGSRKVCDEVLHAIADSRQWNRRYRVVVALVKNPRTPTGIAVRFLPRLSLRDLGFLRFDRNIPDAIRQGARRLYEVRIK